MFLFIPPFASTTLLDVSTYGQKIKILPIFINVATNRRCTLAAHTRPVAGPGPFVKFFSDPKCRKDVLFKIFKKTLFF